MSNSARKSTTGVIKSHSHIRHVKTAEREAEESFRLSNNQHPMIAELKKLCIERRVLQLSEQEETA